MYVPGQIIAVTYEYAGKTYRKKISMMDRNMVTVSVPEDVENLYVYPSDAPVKIEYLRVIKQAPVEPPPEPDDFDLWY
jgi:hypothetical protein